MDRTADEFFRLGVQYYVAGRFSAFAGLHPVAGNQLHHAVEMFAKGALAKTKTLDEIRPLNHKLVDILNELKSIDNRSLDQFDEVGRSLDRYERLRYPNFVIEQGMVSIISIFRSTQKTEITPRPNTQTVFELCVQDIDELVDALFCIAGRNPSAYFSSLRPDARAALERDNTITRFRGAGDTSVSQAAKPDRGSDE